MTVDLFAGLRVSDFGTARAWYERLLGREPSFLPHPTEAVWELDDHRFLYILESEGAGGSLVTFMVDDLDAWVAAGGIEPERREQYEGGARKAIYHDPDGNEIGVGDMGG